MKKVLDNQRNKRLNYSQIMEKPIKYTIFETKWGWFGLASTKNALLRTYLPMRNRKNLKEQLIRDNPPAEYRKELFEPLQRQIIAYFKGTYVNFSLDMPIELDGLSRFSCQVLTACRDIKFGYTTTYGALAKKIHRPGSARAVGQVMAHNRLPLIIPCHRVLRSDGQIGGFSAGGGTKLKQKMLEFEQLYHND
jgi:methylated-DNA-[protein]-cysteine S-methyltransferase